MANAFDPIIANEKREEIEGDIIKSDESMGEIAHDKSDLQSASDSLKDFIQTYITFNKGGSWHLLKSPERDSAGKKYECGDKAISIPEQILFNLRTLPEYIINNKLASIK